MTEEDDAFISGIEFALDWRLPISDDEWRKYQELTREVGEYSGRIDRRNEL